MKLLEDKILAEGIAESENILKVDSFINHQVDPELMKKMGKDIAEHYKGKGITRIATIESSGIAPALMAAEALGVPLVILKKQPSKILNHDLYQTVVTSYTKGTSYELTISAKDEYSGFFVKLFKVSKKPSSSLSLFISNGIFCSRKDCFKNKLTAVDKSSPKSEYNSCADFFNSLSMFIFVLTIILSLPFLFTILII